jgi:hypothetical protein
MLDQRSEAAAFAILCRVGPVLRHEVAGLMQPVRMLVTVLERRTNKPEVDLAATAESISTISLLTKQASAGCMSAFEWIAPPNNASMNLRVGVDELKKLLALELSASALTLENAIPYETLDVPQSFVRLVLIGALLAFSDSQRVPSTLRISTEASALSLSLAPKQGVVMDATHFDSHQRRIDFADAESLAMSFGLTTERGEGWFRIELPTSSSE